MVLAFRASETVNNRRHFDGVFRYARSHGWHVQTFEYFRSEFIRRHGCERINLDDVAGEMGCSRRLATQVFRQSQGRSILDSIHDERLKRVKALLKNSNQDLKSLPDFCGYRSLVDLQRVFKARTGETLGEFRRHAQ